MNLRPRGKTNKTNPEMMIPGQLIAHCSQYWILKEEINGKWYGAFLGDDPNKLESTIDSNLQRTLIPGYGRGHVQICEPPSDEGPAIGD
jgi:hypothetical protein